MQLYALDHKKKILSAWQAKSGERYLCLDCHSALVVRRGKGRVAHFVHLSRSYHHQGKSDLHRATQKRLSDLIGGSLSLEHRFSAIQRIADCYWPERGVVFEVQCSSISPREVCEREKSYGSCGLRVIWVLHDCRFNRWRVGPGEQAMCRGYRIYTNMNERGRGIFYDQTESIWRGRRWRLRGRVMVHPARVLEVLRPDPNWFFRLWRHFRIRLQRRGF